MFEIIKRATARNKNLVRYFTGKPCRKGHIAERYAESGICVECNRYKRNVPVDENVAVFNPYVKEKIDSLRKKADAMELEEHARLERINDMQVKNSTRQAELAEFMEFRNKLADETQYVRVKEPVLPGDLQAAQAVLLSYRLMRDMRVTLDDLWPAQTPKMGVLYTFKCHVLDEAAIRLELKALYSKKPAPRPKNVPELVEAKAQAIVEMIEPTASIFDVTDDTYMS
jgi:hypothetical protein